MNTAEIPWEPVGRFTMKGIPGEQQVFRAVPKHLAWLPDPVANAVKAGTLVEFSRGDRLPMLPPDPVILLEDFVRIGGASAGCIHCRIEPSEFMACDL